MREESGVRSEQNRRSAADTRHPSPLASLAKAGTVLAFDFGAKRIGVAVGESRLRIAHPVATIPAPDRRTRFAAIEQLIAEWRPDLLVVGLPAHMDGNEHEMSRRCRNFARSLEGRFRIPVHLVDERLSSRAAQSALAEAGAAHRRRKAALDPVAAQLILQSFFDEAA